MNMNIGVCSKRPILEPCSLEGTAYRLDPYVGCQHQCQYCYALNRAETDWENEIRIHRDVTGQLREELSALKPQPVYIGWNSDPYQPAESGYRQTRGILELLALRGFPVSLLTKSDLVTRDIDLFSRIPGSSVGISIAFPDEPTRLLFEKHAPPNERRIRALQSLREAGIRTYALICPVMPFLTDVRGLIDRLEPYADTIWVYGLSMAGTDDRNWGNVRRILKERFPDLEREYAQMAFQPGHAYWAGLHRELEKWKEERGVNLRIEL